MMQFMSYNKAQQKLKSLRAKRKKLCSESNGHLCGIDQQNMLYLDQLIEGYERILRDYKSAPTGKRANG